MRRLQHGLGMLIAMFALVGLITVTGCKKEESNGDKMEDVVDDAKDAADDAADKVGDAIDDATDE